MVSRLQEWIVRSIAAGVFSEHRGVVRFALLRSIWTTIAAVILNFFVYQLFGRIGFLDVTLPPNPWSDIIVTAFVAGPICFLAYYFMGRAIMALAVSRDAFERLSRTDPLTGLLNRRAFAEAIAEFHTPYVLAVIDIDRFKQINDTHGHAAGDRVLVEVAAEFRAAFADEAIVARIGGEEFGVAMPDCSREAAMAALARAQSLLAKRMFDVAEGQIAVTFSAGLSHSEGVDGYSALLTDADKALYLAKAAGRNRIVHAEDIATITAPADAPPRVRAV